VGIDEEHIEFILADEGLTFYSKHDLTVGSEKTPYDKIQHLLQALTSFAVRAFQEWESLRMNLPMTIHAVEYLPGMSKPNKPTCVIL
jgi:hypothetical protein